MKIKEKSKQHSLSLKLILNLNFGVRCFTTQSIQTFLKETKETWTFDNKILFGSFSDQFLAE